MVTKKTPSNNKIKIIKDWLSNSWGGIIISLLSAIGVLLTLGYNVGAYTTRNEYENKMINMRLDHQQDLIDVRDKAKEQALSELKSQAEGIEKIYTIISNNNDKKNEK